MPEISAKSQAPLRERGRGLSTIDDSGRIQHRCMESALTAKGQATIPKAIRDHLGLKAGDRVKFFMHPDGSVVILPKRPVAALRGIVKRRPRTVGIAEMNEAIAAGAAIGTPRPKRR